MQINSCINSIYRPRSLQLILMWPWMSWCLSWRLIWFTDEICLLNTWQGILKLMLVLLCIYTLAKKRCPLVQLVFPEQEHKGLRPLVFLIWDHWLKTEEEFFVNRVNSKASQINEQTLGESHFNHALLALELQAVASCISEVNCFMFI